MGTRWQRLVQLWESAQVELHGKYSAERVQALSKYASNTSWMHVTAVLFVTPLPCLILTVLVDTFPLADPSEGVAANKLFFVRDFFTTGVLTFICIHQFRISMSILPYPFWRAFIHSVWITGVCVCLGFGLVVAIGFPVPFKLITLTPPWVTLISISLAFEWIEKIKETPGVETMMKNVLKVWICQCALEFVYPPYYYIFTTLSDRGQLGFAVLLPVIKLSMRNIFARTIVHLSDQMPEVIVFNVEVFNALFVSYCMQNSPSIWTTLGLMFVDIAMIILSIRDMENTRHGLIDLELRIDKERSWSSYCGAIDYGDMGARAPTTLERTRILLEQEAKPEVTLVSPFVQLRRASPSSHDSLQKVHAMVKSHRKSKLRSSRAVVPRSFGCASEPTSLPRNPTKVSLSKASVLPGVSAAKKALLNQTTKLRYTHKVQRLLYMAEFMLLLNYVEVVIPLVFSIYMFVTYQLPNREYYAQLHGMTQSELIQTLENVMCYCSLQIFSLLLLVFILQKKLGLSPIHQLAFVLEKQFSGVQTRLVFWVFYNVQASLQHYGYDYTFQFPWLKDQNGAGSESN